MTNTECPVDIITLLFFSICICHFLSGGKKKRDFLGRYVCRYVHTLDRSTGPITIYKITYKTNVITIIRLL